MITETEKGIILRVKVNPNAKDFQFQGFDEWMNALKVRTKNPAINGKANSELIQELKKIFGTKIELIKGQKNSLKEFLLKEISLNEAQQKLKKL